jgi:hypothetical protein
MFNYVYNKNLRKLVVAFGSLFDSIYVHHSNPDGGNDLEIRVPITYASQEKFIRRFLEPSSITDGVRVETQLPKISYIMTNITPDASRRRNRNTPLIKANTVGNGCSNAGEIITQEIPVNVGFSLFLYTRHIDDTLQIVEQIMPYFNPDHIISMSLTSSTNVNIPITMISNSISEKYDGDFSSRRINISSFNFVAKSYIYGSTQQITTINNTVIGGLTAGLNFDL